MHQEAGGEHVLVHSRLPPVSHWSIRRQQWGLVGEPAPLPLPAPAFALHRCSRHAAPVIPIFLTSEFAAEAGQRLLKMYFFFLFFFFSNQLSMRIGARDRGGGGQCQTVVWGLCRMAPAWLSCCLSFPSHESMSWLFLSKPSTTPAWPWRVSPAQSHHVLGLLFWQDNPGSPECCISGQCSPKLGNPRDGQKALSLQVGWCWDAAGCSEWSVRQGDGLRWDEDAACLPPHGEKTQAGCSQTV